MRLLYVVTADGRLAGFTLLGTAIRFAPIVMALILMFGMRNISAKTAGIFYWAFVATIGAGLGVWLLAYTGASVATTFLATAAAFGGLSLFGYTTKKDLGPIGSFLIVGALGLFIAMIANIFFKSPAIAFVINAAGVLIFAGLIAYDTQRLKTTYYELGGNTEAMGVATNIGALKLYMDFINLFQFLLQFMGNRR